MQLRILIDFLLEGKRTTNISLEMGEAMNHQVNQNEYWMKMFLLKWTILIIIKVECVVFGYTRHTKRKCLCKSSKGNRKH